jgi:hypothetical protein
MSRGNPLLGVDVERVDSTKEFELGSIAWHRGATFIYAKAGGTIAAKTPVKLTGVQTSATDLTGTFTAAASGNGGVVDAVSGATALTSGQYAWFYFQGYVTNVNVAGSTAANALLARIADANGDLVTLHATGAAAGDVTARAKCLENESGGLSDVFLY